MNKNLTSQNNLNISGLGNIIPDEYTYYKKIISPDSQLNLSHASFKWYNLYPESKNISFEQVSKAKEFISLEVQSGKLKLENELGFVILHRAGDYLLLLITTWSNINEIWESVYFKKVDDDAVYKPIEFKTDHKGTFCVWELGIVWHERNSWVKFINSKRDPESKLNYMNDLISGEV